MGHDVFFHRAPLIQTLFMEFVVACGRSRWPPLESLAAHGAVVLHFGQRLLGDRPRSVGKLDRHTTGFLVNI